MKDKKFWRFLVSMSLAALVMGAFTIMSIISFIGCSDVPAGPPWIDGDHNLDFVWTAPPGERIFIASYEMWVAMPGDTFAFNGTSVDTTYTVVLEADGFIQVKVRATGINGMVGPFSEVSDTVWSITVPPGQPGKPWWKP